MSVFAFLAAVAATVAPATDAPRRMDRCQNGPPRRPHLDRAGRFEPVFQHSAELHAAGRQDGGLDERGHRRDRPQDLEDDDDRPGQGPAIAVRRPQDAHGLLYRRRLAGAARGSTTAPAQIWAADIDTGKAHRIADIPAGGIATINADETLLAGAVAERDMPLQPGAVARDPRFDQAGYAALGPDGKPLTFAEAKEVRLNDRLEARIPMEIFTIDIRTGERRVVHRATDWLNHLQFSPTDPTS